MVKVDLDRLKTAITLNDDKHYLGDTREGMLEALEELAEAREQLEEIRDVLGVVVPT